MRLLIKLLLSFWLVATLSASAQLRILADSSLKPILPDLARLWQEDHPGVELELNLANASTLQRLLKEGQPCDIILTADFPDVSAPKEMLTTTQKFFAQNELVVVAKPGLIADEELDWYDLIEREWESVAAPDPAMATCGKAARAAAQKRGIDWQKKNSSQRVADEKAALDCLKRGEAEACFVWRTDVTPLPPAGYKTFRVDAADYPAVRYRAGIATKCAQHALCQEFLLFLTSPIAIQKLKERGYLLP